MLTPEAAKQALEDIFDPDKAQIYCKRHQYFGPMKPGLGVRDVMPTSGCKDCWFVFLFTDIARTPPSERQARLDEMEAVIHKVVELADKGQWDFKPYEHPHITIAPEN
jgi:hypothetical protein